MTTATIDLHDEITRSGGFTFDPTRRALLFPGMWSGYAIAVPGTQRLLGDARMTRERFRDAIRDLVRGNAEHFAAGGMIGGWLSPERGYMIELSEIHYVSRERAVSIGQARNQEAILDMASGEFIATGGTGG